MYRGEAEFLNELNRRRLLLPLNIDSRSGRVGLVNVDGYWDGQAGKFEWEVQVYGERNSCRIRINDQQLRQLADLVDQVLPKPKDPTVVRVELIQITKGRRKKRARVVSQAPAAAGDADPEKDAIKARMLAGR